MKKVIGLLCFLIFSSVVVKGQVVYSSSVFFEQDDAVLVYFDATKGTGGLIDYEGDIYAHTGVITSESSGNSDWKHVKTDWGENTSETKLEKVGDNLYTLEIEPSIAEYYAIDAGEEILKIAFVFRNEDGSLEGKDVGGLDIFLDLYQGGLQVAFTSPLGDAVVIEEGETLSVEALATQNANLELFVNDQAVVQEIGTNLNYLLPIEGNVLYKLRVEATEGGNVAVDSFCVVGQGAVEVADLPEGMKDGVNYIDDETAILSLYAPDKEYVYIVGDFNNWQFSPEYYMKKTTDGLRFWLEINDLNSGEEYAYQYLIDGTVKVADPYTEKILDPWRDGDIPEDTYPNLKPYPQEKTTGIVSVLQTAQTEYTWQNTTFERPEKEDLIVYELLIRDFFEADDRTFQALIDTLGYLEKLGVNAIELMPVTEFENNDSWGYNPSFMLAVDKYYGTKNKFKELVDKCHEKGMAVIVDMVLNHQFGQSPLVQMYPLNNNPFFNETPKHDFNVGYDMNHESPATRDFVRRVLSHWMEEFKVDGFRFDLSKGFTQNNTLGNVGAWGQYDEARVQLWKELYDFMQAESEDVYVILEHFADNSEEKELANYGMMIWGNLNHDYLEATMGYSGDLNWGSYQTRGYDEPNLITYMESHDEERMMYKNLAYGNANGEYDVKDIEVGLERTKLAAAFFFTIPGPKMLWEFEELGYDESINACPNGTISEGCRTDAKEVHWEYLEDPARLRLLEVFKTLIQLRKDYPVFQTDNFDLAVGGKAKRINLYDNDMNVTIVGNFDVSEQAINPQFPSGGMWYDYFTGESIQVDDVNAEMTLKQGEFHLYTSVALPTPDTDLLDFSVYTESALANDFEVSIYPNPLKEEATITYTLKEQSPVQFEVIDNTGKTVKSWETATLPTGTHTVSWKADNQEGKRLSSGFYFVKVSTSMGTTVEKVVVN